MNKAIKMLVEVDSLLLATKMVLPCIYKAGLLVVVPKYLSGMIILGMLAGGYYKSKEIKNKKKDTDLTDSNLFKLED